MKEAVVDEVELGLIDETIRLIALKGRIVEVMDLDKEILSHRFSSDALKNLFFAQFDIDYMGG